MMDEKIGETKAPENEEFRFYSGFDRLNAPPSDGKRFRPRREKKRPRKEEVVA
jgi:hypothetical protein